MGGEGRTRKLAAGMTKDDIPRIIKELKSAPQDGKEKSAYLLDIMAEQEENVKAMVKAGAIGPLVELVASGNDGGQIHACSTLAQIALAETDFTSEGNPRDAIVLAGAITPLVSVLRSGSEKAQMHAAAALASLSEDPENQMPIIKAGAIAPLVRLLRVGTDDAKISAADCVANVSAANMEAQAAVHAAGAVPLLLEMLKGGKAQQAAANALAKLLWPGDDPY